VKLASLLFAERCEQVLLGFTRELAGACEHPLAARCEVERVGAAVARVRAPLYEALGLELVDRGDHRAGVGPDALARAFCVEHVERAPRARAQLEPCQALGELLGCDHQGGRDAPVLPVVTLPAGTPVSSRPVRAGLAQMEATLRKAIPGVRTASFASAGNRAFVSADGRTTFVLAYPSPDKEAFGGDTEGALGQMSSHRSRSGQARNWTR